MQVPTSTKTLSAGSGDMGCSLCRSWTYKTVKEGDVN